MPGSGLKDGHLRSIDSGVPCVKYVKSVGVDSIILLNNNFLVTRSIRLFLKSFSSLCILSSLSYKHSYYSYWK